MQIRSVLLLPALLAALALDASAFDQTGIDDATRKQLLSNLGSKISAEYVFPDKAKLIAERLEAKEKSGAYGAAKDLGQLADMLTEDLRHPTQDRHLGVRHSVQPVPEIANGPAPTPEMDRMLEEHMKARNYGIHKVETLPGNIGYIDLRSFPAARFAKPALSAAMNQVADTDALIVDLRYFSYNLQQLRRALIVGETTGGGAHPGRIHRLHPHLTVFIPNGRAINPISKTNWEGTGVAPDVKVKAADALRTAERLALTELLKSPNDDAHAQLLRQRLGALQ